MMNGLKIAVGALAVAGCQGVLGVDHWTPKPTASDAGGHRDAASDAREGGVPFKFADETCGACVETKCTTEHQACQLEEACAEWEGCMMAKCKPGEGACERDCFLAAGETDRTMGDIAACTLEHCYDDCQATGVWPGQGAECGKVVRQTLPDQALACSQDERCLKVTRCTFENSCTFTPPGAAGTSSGIQGLNPSCMEQCLDSVRAYEPDVTEAGTLAPSAVINLSLAIALSVAVSENCAEGETTCTERFEWAQPPQGPIQMEFLVTDGFVPELPRTPLAGVPVRACRVAAPPCRDPVGSGTTGPDGRTSFSITNRNPLEADDLYFEMLPGRFGAVGKVLSHKGRRYSADTMISLNLLEYLLEAGMPENDFESLRTWSKDRGAIFVASRACSERLLRGAEFRLNGDRSVPMDYMITGYKPVPRSDDTTAVYIPNLTEGLYEVSAWLGEDEIARANVVVEADALSTVTMFPKHALQGAANPAP